MGNDESLLRKFTDEDLLNLMSQAIEQYKLLSQTSDKVAVAEKKDEVCQLYNLLKQRGIVVPVAGNA